jgi:hypothetical protein
MAVHPIARDVWIEMTKAKGMIRALNIFRGMHAPSPANFGALAKIFVGVVSRARGKVRDHAGVIASTRGTRARL